MDKETLSNYGWIVICVLVLAVMLALATPFGNFISTAVKSTTQGLFDVNKNALNSTGLINVGDQSFDSKDLNTEKATFYYDNGEYLYMQIPVSGNMVGATTIEEGRKFVKEYATQIFGTSFDDLLAQGVTEDAIWNEVGLTEDTFEPAVLGNGWGVRVKDTSKTSYGPILESINGEPITSVDGTFYDCESLIVSPEIPSGVTNMSNTFGGCRALTKAPAIPDGVTNMEYTFDACDSLTVAPTIPKGVTDMTYTFYNCTSLTTAPTIPNSVTDMSGTFDSCTSLTTAPVIPSSVTNMQCTFWNCTKLTTAPVIPNGVTNMSYTFYNCTSLTTAPTIPNSVTDMSGTFYSCESLTTAPTIPNGVTDMTHTFYNCTFLTTPPDMSNATSITDMSSTFYRCTSLTGTIEINANPTEYDGCFSGTSKQIILTGSSTMLSQIAGGRSNITIQ